MKYVVLLAFFTSADGKNVLLQNTTNIEVADRPSCVAAASGVWDGFKNNKLVNIAAWCIPKNASDGQVERLTLVR